MLSDVFNTLDKLHIEEDFISKALNLNPNKLDVLTDAEVSKYCFALSQYLVYYKYQYNKTKSEQVRLKHLIDSTVFQLLTDDLIKRFKTKTDARNYLISSNITLNNLNDDLLRIDNELILGSDLDISIQEVINVLKKEMSRRPHELGVTRYERKGK
jgi:hypothetical protein